MKYFWIAACALLVSSSAQAQLYRWVDEKGSVHYTDQPPPATAKKVEEKRFTDNVVQTDRLPYSVQQAMKNFPVTLFTGDCGDACAQGKAYLVKRGIPFSERLPGKNVADLEQLKKVMPENLIPVLLVGQSVKLKGFNESEWAGALDRAGYPKTNPGTAPAAPSAPSAPPPAAPAPAAPPNNNPQPY